MASSGKYLPAPIDKLLSDFTAQDFPFTWNIHNNGITVSLNVSWTVTDQKRIPVRILQNKAPSTLKRDRERMTEFMLRKDEQNMINATHTNKMQVSSFSCSPTLKATNSLSTQTTSNSCASVSVQTLQSSFLATTDRDSMCDFRPEVKNSTVQTYNVPSMTIHTQTDRIGCEPENSQPSKLIGNDRASVKQTETVLKRRIKGEQVEYLVKWQNRPSNKNTWIAENKLDSAAINYIRMNDGQIRGPHPPPCPSKHGNRQNLEAVVAPVRSQLNTCGRTTSTSKRIPVRVKDIHGNSVDVVEILCGKSYYDVNTYDVRCANGRKAEIPIEATPDDFEQILYGDR